MKKVLYLLPFLPVFAAAQPTTWESKGIGGGGALFAPSISPHNASDIYLQCDMSEVFHTTDKGASWKEVDFRELVSNGGYYTVEYTSNPSILYTLNLDYFTDERYLVKSVDGGQTWGITAADPTNADGWYVSADPESEGRLLVATYDELFFSDDGATSFQGVYANSDLHIAGVFWDGTNIYVGTRYGMLVSTDNGASFSLDNTAGIPAGHGFISFTGSKSGGTTRLVGTIAPQGDLYPGINALDIGICDGLLKMDVGATSWQSAMNGIDPDHPIFLVASARNDINTFYTGGTNTNNSFVVVYKTENAGASWSETFLTNNNQNITTGWSGYQGDDNWWYGEIVFGLDVAPNDANTAIFTDFGFAHVTSDGGDTWDQAYVQAADANPAGTPTPADQSYAGNGLENTSCWNLLWTDPNTIFASFTDITAIRSTDGGEKWAYDYSGINWNTVYHTIKAPNGTLYAAVSTVHDLYQSTYLGDGNIDNGNGAILYSTDNGVTWQMLHDFSMPVIWLALDPNDANTLYTSVVNSTAGGIFKTTNLGNGPAATWTITGTPPRTEGHPYNVYVLNDGTVVSTWSGHRDPGFTASSGVFVSVNGGTGWTDVSMDDEMHYWTKDIVIDPTDPAQDTWYVAVHSGWGGLANDKGGLYKTTNRGASWTLLFDSDRVESATVNPNDANEMYITTEAEGLWYTASAAAPVPTFTPLTAYTFQHPMRVFYNPNDNDDIWVTSFGNSLKKGTTGTGSISQTTESLAVNVFPNPAKESCEVTAETGLVSVKLVNALGETVYIHAPPAHTSVTIPTAAFQPGIYFLHCTDLHGKTVMKKIVIRR